MCTLQEWSLCFPQSCGAGLIKPFLASKSNTLGHPPPDQTPKLVNLTWGSEISLLWDNIFDIIVLPYLHHQFRGYEIWLHHPPTISVWLLLYVLDVEYISWWISVLFINDHSAVNYNFHVVMRGYEFKFFFYSAILSSLLSTITLMKRCLKGSYYQSSIRKTETSNNTVWLSGKESTCQCKGSTPGLGRSPGKRNDNPLQYSCLGNSVDRGARQITGHGVTKE